MLMNTRQRNFLNTCTDTPQHTACFLAKVTLAEPAIDPHVVLTSTRTSTEGNHASAIHFRKIAPGSVPNRTAGRKFSFLGEKPVPELFFMVDKRSRLPRRWPTAFLV